MAYPEQENTGLFIPTTNIWDVLPEDAETVSIDMFKELLLRLSQNMSNTSRTVDLADKGYYALTEFVNGQSFFPNPTLTPADGNYLIGRQAYRKVIDFGILPNNAQKVVAHGLAINSAWTFTRIYATASNPTGLQYFPIGINGTTINVDSINVLINTTSDMTAFTRCICVLEYLKQ